MSHYKKAHVKLIPNQRLSKSGGNRANEKSPSSIKKSYYNSYN